MLKTLDTLTLVDKKILIRLDLNVPMQAGKIKNTERIHRALPTIRYALAQGGIVRLMSHLGRPQPGGVDPELSLAPIATYLSQILACPVQLCSAPAELAQSTARVALLENVRFFQGETTNDVDLARQYAACGDVFVMDAFGTAHRQHASTLGVMQASEQVCAGFLFQDEIKALTQALQSPKTPVLAVVGGAKVSTKLTLLTSLATKVDQLMVGGGIANTFLAAQGYAIGTSLYEPSMITAARDIMAQVDVILPRDVVVASACTATATVRVSSVTDVQADEMILDMGPEYIKLLPNLIQPVGTILWNGPLGVFELPPFAEGTRVLAKAIATSSGFSIAGGGDTLAAIAQFKCTNDIDYISTGGGAFLAFIEQGTLPCLPMLTA